jgi:hypothetical protein
MALSRINSGKNSPVPLILLLACVAISVVVMLLVPRVPQWDSYHRFADARPMFGIPNFMDVASNSLFILLGFWGMVESRSGWKRAGGSGRQVHVAYLVFFASLFLTGFGSAWYHLNPNNESLFWDRFPLSIAFVSLFAAVVHERFSIRGGPALLLCAVLLAAASVLYWSFSERSGVGDLRPYLLVQFLPMALIPILLLLFPSPYDRVGDLWRVLGLYALAKVLEVFDRPIWEVNHLVSGHTLKHLLSAAAVFQLAWMLRFRALRSAKGARPPG